MATADDFPATGKVTANLGEKIVFNPTGTNYELHLSPAGGAYRGPVGALVRGRVRVTARKVYTVPAGGGFVSPIFGPPKTIQGRAMVVGERQLVLKAGVPVVVDLPGDDAAIDLDDGRIVAGRIVNVVAMPGATFELIEQAELAK